MYLNRFWCHNSGFCHQKAHISHKTRNISVNLHYNAFSTVNTVFYGKWKPFVDKKMNCDIRNDLNILFLSFRTYIYYVSHCKSVETIKLCFEWHNYPKIYIFKSKFPKIKKTPKLSQSEFPNFFSVVQRFFNIRPNISTYILFWSGLLSACHI